MRTSMWITLDGLTRALRLRAHQVSDRLEMRKRPEPDEHRARRWTRRSIKERRRAGERGGN
jgi:hypothetical protein